MRLDRDTTYIGIGKTEGFRYVAIHPPLSLSEAGALREERLVDDVISLNQVRDGLEHTLLGFDRDESRVDVGKIGRKVAELRGHHLRIITSVEVPIDDSNSGVIFDSF